MIVFNGCYTHSSTSGNIPLKYYLGVATPANYQIVVKEVLLENNYHIENYENTATSAQIITFASDCNAAL